MENIDNNEQTQAICHEGGIFLDAGAGSGKTHVIVAHIFYRIELFWERLPFDDKKQLKKYKDQLRKFIHQTFLVTFTKKATKEIEQRIKKTILLKIEELKGSLEIENQPKIDFYRWIYENFGLFNISTIHSLCLNLIEKGIFPGLPTNVKISSDSHHSMLLNRYLKEFLENKYPQQKLKVEFILDKIKTTKLGIFRVFNDPSIRMNWAKNVKVDWGEYFVKLEEVVTFKRALNQQSFRNALENYWSKNKRSLKLTQGQQTLENWLNLLIQHDINTSKDLGDQAKLTVVIKNLLEVGRFVPPKDFDEEIIEDFKNLRNFFKEKENQLAFKNLLVDSHEMESWSVFFRELFTFLNEKMSPFESMTYSDLEYYVEEGLNGNLAKLKAQEIVSYIIVDEFQDTSPVQFSIISKLINHNFESIFCVGDAKQAIYGFRGSDLNVFLEGRLKSKLVYHLKNNYRSSEAVVNFNNQLFSYLLNQNNEKDQNFIVDQISKRVDCGEGNVTILKPKNQIDPKAEIDTHQAQIWETDLIVFRIKELMKLYPHQKIAILYRKLNTSEKLIKKLRDESINYKAQVKIPYGDDPIMGIFKNLIEYLIVEKNEFNFLSSEHIIKNYVKILNLENINQESDEFNYNVSAVLKKFPEQVALWGIGSGFKKFLFDLNISNSIFEYNMDLIEEIILLSNGELTKIHEIINENSSRKFSLELDFYQNSQQNLEGPQVQVIIQTIHSSKGLEYDHVILGGMNTGGENNKEVLPFGKTSESFIYIQDSDESKTPTLILEEIQKKRDEELESLRLFYVACTRAKVSLTFCDLNLPPNSIRNQSKTWIEFFHEFSDFWVQSKMHSSGGNLPYQIKYSENERVIETEGQESPTLPLFHADFVGVIKTPKVKGQFLGYTGELSVTKWSSLALCSRKFYFENCLKIEEEELNLGNFVSSLKNDPKVEISEDQIKSSKERGTLIHSVLNLYLEHDSHLLTELSLLSSKDQKFLKDKIFIWLNELKSQYHLKSEVPLKFNIGGMNISGSVDLYGENRIKESPDILIDYKTGLPNKIHEKSYWLQIKTYAYGLYLLKKIPPNKDIVISLIYVDVWEIISMKLSMKEILQEINQHIKKLDYLFEMNLEYCQQCLFKNLCH